MTIKELLTTIQADLQGVNGVQVDPTLLQEALLLEVETAFLLDIGSEGLAVENAYSEIGFRDNYVRLKVGQEVYDEVLQFIETDMLSQAILESADLQEESTE